MTESIDEINARLKRESEARVVTGRGSLQNLDELQEGTIVRNDSALTSGNFTSEQNTVVVDTGDKSLESLAAEASGSDGTHALSNETPGKQDAKKDIEEKRDTGEITDREFRTRTAIIEQSHVGDPEKTAATQSTFAPPPPKLAIERFIEPRVPVVVTTVIPEARQHQTSNSVIMTDENQAKYRELLDAVEQARGDRQLGDIPLSDPYWGKQNEITVFLANMRS